MFRAHTHTHTHTHIYIYYYFSRVLGGPKASGPPLPVFICFGYGHFQALVNEGKVGGFHLWFLDGKEWVRVN